jgi:AcrR family transcriptional regulator
VSPRPQIDHIRRPQILAAASEVIAERGVAGTRIADVAKRCGVSPPAVLYWFDSREQLLAEALIVEEERFYGGLSERLAAATCARERLLSLIEAAVDGAADFVLWMELWTWALRDDGLRRARERFDSRWRREIEEIVREGGAAGEFGEMDPSLAALAIGGLIDGLTVQVALGDPEVSEARLRETAIAGAERLLECELENGKVGERASR